MLLAGLDRPRNVIAFPGTQRGQDLLMDSPDEVEAAQLDELALRIVPPPNEDD
jgi:aspartyl-tRNA synthetase